MHNGAVTKDWNLHPHRSCWHGSGPVDNGHGAHQTPGLHVANISPPLENVYIQRSSVRNDL